MTNKKSKFIRVLHVVDGLSYGGVESMLYNYHHMNPNFKIMIISHGKISQRDSGRFQKFNIPSVKVTPKRISIIKNFLELQKIISTFRPDIVHVHMNLSSYMALFIAWLHKIPVRIYHSHAAIPKRAITDTPKRLVNNLLCTHRFACTKNAAFYAFGKHVNSACIIPNAFRIDKFIFNESARAKIRKQLNIDDNTILLGNVGRYTPQKNHLFLFGVLKELPKQYKLLLIGNGELEDILKNRVSQLNIQNRVLFIKPIDNPASYYSAMDIFVFPSLYEGLGIALIEAQIEGLPCLASDVVPHDAFISKRCVALPLERNIWKYKISNCAKPNIRTTNLQHFEQFNITSKKNLLYDIYSELIDSHHSRSPKGVK